MAKCEVPDQTPPWKGGGRSGTAHFANSLLGDYGAKRVKNKVRFHSLVDRCQHWGLFISFILPEDKLYELWVMKTYKNSPDIFELTSFDCI